jgi:hypothetical protein
MSIPGNRQTLHPGKISALARLGDVNLLVSLNVVSSGGYALQHDWRRSIYFVLSGAIIAAVTY